jgi:hypothetical protein
MHRRSFISRFSILSAGACFPSLVTRSFLNSDKSPFAKHLQPIGRALEMEDYYVWCNSPIQDDDGKVHVFFLRWIAKKGMGGWIAVSQGKIACMDNSYPKWRIQTKQRGAARPYAIVGVPK